MRLDVFLLEYEPVIRLLCFAGVFIVLALGEVIKPRRHLTISKIKRWINNISLVFINNLCIRLLFPAAAIGVGAFAWQQQWGLMYYFTIPPILSIVISVIILDFAIYLQHIMLHAVPILWRIHRVHHADLDFDLTTGIRFHPFEIIISLLIKFSVILLFGIPVLAIILFEIVLNATSLFNHSNLAIPKKLDSLLRLLIVTPDMHRVHHSVRINETNSNFGFNLSWWDRLLGTYRSQPKLGHQNMTIGLTTHRNPKQVTTLSGSLRLPFLPTTATYTINRAPLHPDHKDNSSKRDEID